jgi:SAM-dependent methyltransferase
MASHEADHWWFVGRRAVLDGVLARITLPPGARILEAGCGTGGNLVLLEGRGQVSAFEPHRVALEMARERHPGTIIEAGALPDAMPFEEGTFDLVAALDVLEHVVDDRAAIEALVRQARPGGYILISVPTHPILFGSHDRRLHHVRRYDIRELEALVRVQGCNVEYFGAYNSLLAPLAFTLRLAERVLPVDFGNQERRPVQPLNAVLAWTFAMEGQLVRRWVLPFGLSHVAMLRRL